MDAFKSQPEIGLFLNAVEGHTIGLLTHDVDPDREEEFLEWQRGITTVASKFPGYHRTILYPPKEGAHKSWIVSIHFETPENLDAWLKSEERQRWLDEHAPPFTGFRLKRGEVGLETWFKTDEDGSGSAPPDWRMVLAVVLALYPTLVGLNLWVDPDLPKMTVALSLLVGSFLGVAVLQWFAMPIVSRCFGWWLGPVEKVGWRMSLAGVVIIGVLLALMLLLASGLMSSGS